MVFVRYEDKEGRRFHAVAKNRTVVQDSGDEKVVQRYYRYSHYAFVTRKELEQLDLPLLRDGIKAVSEEDHDIYFIW